MKLTLSSLLHLANDVSKIFKPTRVGCEATAETTNEEYVSQITSEVVKHILENKNGEFEIECDVYPSQIDFANAIFEAFKRSKIIIGKAPMQFGKTGTIHYLCNHLIGPTLKQDENVIFMTAMSDTALFIQNQLNLQKDYIDFDGSKKTSKIVVVKMIPDFRRNAEKLIKDYNAKMIVFDECDYGSG